jgi:ABC-type glutathione transport system ATPase component
VEIQTDILEWLSLQPGTKERLFWITGIAGSGKSTLSATLVDNLRKKGTPVAAQFFISRNIPQTIDPGKISTTISQQLAEFSPDAAHIIQDKLKNGFPSSRKEQVEALLANGISGLRGYSINIDGFDPPQSSANFTCT